MRLRSSRTFSQHQLAVKLRVEKARTGFFSWERRHFIIHVTKTALAATLAWWIARLVGMPDGYWGSISAVIVLQSNVGATVTASRNRFLGTVVGAAVGFACSLFGTLPWNYILAIILALSICGICGLTNSSRLSGVTVSIVMLVQATGPRWQLACFRVSEVFIGIVMALAVSTLILPDRARLHLRDGLAQEFLVLSVFFESILEGFGGSPSQQLATFRGDVLSRLRANNQLLQAARSEPSGGSGWREGFGMLAQFGRSINDALLALEFSVRDSHHDAYALQLEPELGRLALHIRTGFHHVAKCIHEWRFDVPPDGFSLEQDIADLEARMDAVRHTGSNFSQAEILRAYAVQLHLKQIARLLRASRIETNRAIGKLDKQDQSAEDSASVSSSEKPAS
ncbi:MAG: FUSC family protein [Terracidiphilus sp.]|nr:FUSC family protein [Terracidiphilus sp.]